jgi:SAM-dependent methyltransferase
MGLGFRVRLADLLEKASRALVQQEWIPPLTLRAHVGRLEDYERIPEEYIAYLKLLCGLTMESSLLDIGCGSGRFARHLLTAPHLFRGIYRGFDIDARSIDWARKNIPNGSADVAFTHVDLVNRNYHPGGRLNAEEYRFGYEDNTFDVVLAMSVFTHLLPPTMETYFREIARVMKPTGKALLTFLLLDGQPPGLGREAAEYWRKFLNHLKVDGQWQHHQDYSVICPAVPEAMTAHQMEAVDRRLDAAGLRVESVHPGSWSTRENPLSFQDVLIISRK